MRSALYLAASLTIVAAIAGLAALWVHMSHTRPIAEGRVIIPLWSTHGIHTVDLIFLGAGMILVAMLVSVLLAGFSRR